MFFFSLDKKPMPGEEQSLKKRSAQKRKFVEDSSDESECEVILSPVKDSDENGQRLRAPAKTKPTSTSLLSSPSPVKMDSDENVQRLRAPAKTKPTSYSRLSSPSHASTPSKSKPSSIASRLSVLNAKVLAMSEESESKSSPEKVSHWKNQLTDCIWWF